MSTKISYCDETWNPITGCPLPFCSAGCENCWARELHNMRHKAYLVGNKLPQMYAKPFEEIQFFPERLEQPLHWEKPRRIFVGSQTDLFHDSVPFEWLDKIMAVIALCPQHEFLFLTKREKRMAEYFDLSTDNREEAIGHWMVLKSGGDNVGLTDLPLPNLSLGLTICNQKEFNEKIPSLLQTPAAKRWLSAEPMLERIIFDPFYFHHKGGIDWVVVGCESGRPHHRPCKTEWIEWVIDQCMAAGVPVFVKQVNINGRVSHNMAEWPEELRKQDLPK